MQLITGISRADANVAVAANDHLCAVSIGAELETIRVGAVIVDDAASRAIVSTSGSLASAGVVSEPDGGWQFDSVWRSRLNPASWAALMMVRMVTSPGRASVEIDAHCAGASA